MANSDFTDVTEMAGEEISSEQLFRLANRYYWASEYVRDNDVLEVACGTGPGLGYLAGISKSLVAGDFSGVMVEVVKNHYGERIDVKQFDAQEMPYPDASLDVVIIFEALYYVPTAEKFVEECKRILRPGGYVLVSNANKDLFDFNPSPYSSVYHGVKELTDLFETAGFKTKFWGSTPIATIGIRQKIMRPLKSIAVNSGLMPKSMTGKRLLKRLVFGNPVVMPAEIGDHTAPVETPDELQAGLPNDQFKVIYCAAHKP